jgi:hypothetical protein
MEELIYGVTFYHDGQVIVETGQSEWCITGQGTATMTCKIQLTPVESMVINLKNICTI